MQMQDFTVHAVRILRHLHEHQDSAQTGAVIAKSVGISYHAFLQIMLRLKRKGLLLAQTHGRKGGYVLGKPVHEISIYDVFSCFEDEWQTNHSQRDSIDTVDMLRVEVASGSPPEQLYRVQAADEKIHMVPVDEIILIQPGQQQGILELHQEHGLLEFRGRISRVVVNSPAFFRSHMSVVVNVNHIKNIDVEKREIELTNGRFVPIAKQKIPVLLRLMAIGDRLEWAFEGETQGGIEIGQNAKL